MGSAPGLHDDDHTGQPLPHMLRAWLSQFGSYAGRKFLEQHAEALLTHDIEQVLAEEITLRTEKAEDVDDLTERLAIVREARRRGRHIDAIRETYVNHKGGFTLDLPDWFDDVISRYLDLSILAPERSASARIDLFTEALAHAAAEPERVPSEAVAELHNKRAIAYKEDPRSDRSSAIEAAIADHTEALHVYTRQRYPRQWALTQNNLGYAFAKRIAGNRADNLEQTIAHFRAAQRVYTRARFPVQHATILNNLGGAYQERRAGSPRDNHERAIRYLRRALDMWTRLDTPFQQAHTLYNLGAAYEDRIAGSRRDNLELAIACFRATLDLLASVDPSHRYALIDYAHAKNHLALAYVERISGRSRDNVEEALQHLTEAAGALDSDHFPVEWALTQHNLGLAYHGRVAGSKRDNLEEARDHYLAALRVRTRELAPLDYATTQNNLGIVYKDRISGDPRENLDAAIACFHAALEIRTVTATPLDYAATQNNLGGAYWNNRFGNRSEHIERAVACFSEALAVYEQSDAMEDRAMAFMNLGIALWSRIEGDREANLERARVCLEQALKVYTENAFPERHAVAQSNLGAIYLRRLTGARAENLARATTCFNVALGICSADKDSLAFRDAHLNLASLAFEGVALEAFERGDAEAVRAAYVDAHEHYRIARECQRNLGWLESDEQGRARLQGAHHATRELYARDAWCLLRLGDVRSAVEALEEGRAQALLEAQSIAGALAEHICAEHLAAYTAARHGLEEARSGSRTQRRSARDHLLALRRVIQEHCAPEFLQDATAYDEIARASSPDQAVIYVAACEFGGFALVVPPHPEAQAPISPPFEIRLPHLSWRVVDDWLRTPDDANRVRSGYQLALQRQGMTTLLRVLFQETDERTLAAVLDLPLSDLPDLLPESMGTIRVALSRAVRDLFGPRSAISSASPQPSTPSADPADGQRMVERMATSPSSDSPSVGDIFADSSALRRLSSQLAWHHQIAELDVLLPALSQVVIQPLCQGLAEHGPEGTHQRIALVPCGRLGVLPLHAAPVCQGGPPFAETAELTYQASARTLKHARLAAAKLSLCGPIFSVGNPQHTEDEGALPHARREAVAIAQIGRAAGYAASVAVVGEKATRLRILAELRRFREEAPGSWFHFAGHGRASVYDPSESYMALYGFDADGRPERLSLDMLQREHLLTGIFGVTASGCVTGLGDMELAPDELNSYAAGLLQAGAVCVVATLWSVKDYATSLLMTRFHRIRLCHPAPSPAAALREAAHWLRTASRSSIDAFARESGLPGWADVDGTRDAVRGDVSPEPLASVKPARADRTFLHGIAAVATDLAPSPDGSRSVLELDLSSEPTDHDAPYAHPIYWAAPIIVGMS